MENDREILLYPLDVPGAAEIDGLRGLERGLGDLATSSFASPSPYVYACSFTSWARDDRIARAAFRASVRQIVPQPPCWDARSREDGGVDVVVEVNGGATNALEIKRFDREGKIAGAEIAAPQEGPIFVSLEDAERAGAASSISSAAPSGSYNAPRFVRGVRLGVAAPVIAIDDERGVVLFRPSRDAAYAYARTSIEASEAAALTWSGETFVAAKRGVRGEPRMGTRARPGTLELHRLGADGEPVAPPQSILDGATIYDFDVCGWAFGVAALVTVAGGTRLVLVPIDGSPPIVIDVVRPPLPEGAIAYGPLSCVALTDIDGSLHVAGLEHERTHEARVWAGIWRPGAIPLGAARAARV